MKKVVHKILAVFMVTILMVSTTSFSIYKHFCGENLVNVSRYTQIDNCCEAEKKHKPLPNLNFSEEDCCKNKTEITPQLTFENTKSSKLIISQVIFITSFYQTFIEQKEKNSQTDFYNNFSPPEIVYNKQVQYQNFLI